LYGAGHPHKVELPKGLVYKTLWKGGAKTEGFSEVDREKTRAGGP